jgi:hypothetical protein
VPVPVPVPAPVETPEQKTQREAFEESIKAYTPSDQEKASLEKMKVDYPELAMAVDSLLKSREREVNARVYNTALSLYDQMNRRITPVEQGFNEDSLERHLERIEAKHPDYEQVRPLLEPWIAAKDSLDRPGLEQAFKEGRTSDVIKLVDRFKAETRPPVSTPAPVLAPVLAPVSPPAPVRPTDADSLLPVSGRRTTPVPAGSVDKNDFDGAFAEAAALADGER